MGSLAYKWERSRAPCSRMATARASMSSSLAPGLTIQTRRAPRPATVVPAMKACPLCWTAVRMLLLSWSSCAGVPFQPASRAVSHGRRLGPVPDPGQRFGRALGHGAGGGADLAGPAPAEFRDAYGHDVGAGPLRSGRPLARARLSRHGRMKASS